MQLLQLRPVPLPSLLIHIQQQHSLTTSKCMIDVECGMCLQDLKPIRYMWYTWCTQYLHMRHLFSSTSNNYTSFDYNLDNLQCHTFRSKCTRSSRQIVIWRPMWTGSELKSCIWLGLLCKFWLCSTERNT